MVMFGSVGPEVLQLQQLLNRIMTGDPPLVPDSRFGPVTRSRVMGFQNNAGLTPDGIAGPLTFSALGDFINRLLPGPPPPPPPVPAVRLITEDILGTFPSSNNLISQVIPPIPLIDTNLYRANVSDPLRFRLASPTFGRLAIFACQKDGVQRAVILLLPPLTNPDSILICITQGFAQAAKTLNPLHWENPLSPDLIKFCLLKHVVNRYGPQTLASRKNIGLMYIVRSRGKELGPFAQDGQFVLQCLTEMAALTNNAFSFDQVEAFTFSSGISDFNPFIASIKNSLNIAAVYSIDPAGAMPTGQPDQGTRKQYLSGQTGGFGPTGVKAGFEGLPLNRWKGEVRFGEVPTLGVFNYMHNYVMPCYVLNLGLDSFN